MLPTSQKDVLPALQKSSVIYEYKCHRDSRYVGRTSQRLQDRIKQHIPKWLRQQLTGATKRTQPGRACKQSQATPECDSAIGQHFLENAQCAANYNEDQFSILDITRNGFHLSVLEASYIRERRLILCKQNEFILLICSNRVRACRDLSNEKSHAISSMFGQFCFIVASLRPRFVDVQMV